MWIAAAIFVAMIILVVFLVYGSGGPDPEERYCAKCGKVGMWHPKRGCEHCVWCDRQW